MTIGISSRGLEFQSGGVKEYIHQICLNLPKVAPQHQFVIFHDIPDTVGNYPAPNVTEVHVKSLSWLDKLSREVSRMYWDHVQLTLAARKYNLDVMLFPKYERPIFFGNKSVAVFHDLAYFMPKLKAYKFLEGVYKAIFVPITVWTANRIVTVSENTRQDTIRIIPFTNPNKVVTVYEDAAYKDNGKTDHSYVREKYGIGNLPFVFMSSDISPRKNLPRALQAIAQIKDEIPHKFAITGGKKWTKGDIHDLVEELGIADKFVKLGFVEDEDMHSVYREADVYFHPSIYEGFGMTLLEAMHADTPVCYSDISSHPEVAGDAGLPFDPYDIDDMANKLQTLCTNKQLQEQLVAEGRENIKRFSWKKTAQGLLKVLEGVANK